MRDSDVQLTSLLSSDFGSGRWGGGRATITDAFYQYRNAAGAKGPFTVIEAHVTWEDDAGAPHEVRYSCGSGEYGCIREEPSEDSAEAEKGYGLSGRNGKRFQLRADDEFGQLLTSLYANGVPESRIGNDIRNLVGIEAELVERPHSGKKPGEDKYPMLLAAQVLNVSSKGSKAAAGSSKRSAAAAAEEDEKPARRTSAKKSTPESKAKQIVIDALAEGDGTTTTNDVVRSAAKALKGDEDRKEILDLLGDDDWYGDQDEWVFKKRTGQIVEAK